VGESATSRRAIQVGVVGAVLAGIAAIWEPLDGIFRQTVILNNLFLSILAALTSLGVVGIVLTQRARGRGAEGRFDAAMRVLAIVEVLFLIAVWVTASMTGAINPDIRPGTGVLQLER
jgi:hypothetical protein